MLSDLWLRPVKSSDFEALLALSQKVGVGLSSFPKEPESLKNKIKRAVDSIKPETTPNTPGLYFFVLMLGQDKIIGTSAIETGVGSEQPFYNFKLSQHHAYNKKLELSMTTDMALLVTDLEGATELGTLFLLPEYRKPYVGQFLSRVRFLWLAAHKERIKDPIFAEMRGYLDKNKRSPFWEYLGKRFVGLDFDTADQLVSHGNKQLISDLMPRSPIYLSLLPKVAQRVMGRPQNETRPALKILKKEGFQRNDYIDIFDGGPTVSARWQDITTIQKSQTAIFLKTESSIPQDQPLYMVSNDKLDFRATISPLTQTKAGVLLPPETAKKLKIKPEENLRYIPFPCMPIS